MTSRPTDLVRTHFPAMFASSCANQRSQGPVSADHERPFTDISLVITGLEAHGQYEVSVDGRRWAWFNNLNFPYFLTFGFAMPDITREQLHAYLDDALSDPETAQVEQALRDSESLRKLLQQALLERDRGEHSLGAVWRRERLTCPTRDQLGSYLLQVLEPDLLDYIHFHLNTIGCVFCQANLQDLMAQQQESPGEARQRWKRFFKSSAGYLEGNRDGAR